MSKLGLNYRKNQLPNLYIIAGCNGAGKTTASFTILPELLDCKEFINADEIARGLSPFQPEKVAIQSGRIMLHRLNELLQSKEDFAFETTLSTRSYVSFVKKAQQLNFNVILIYFWLNSVDLAKERVKIRVSEGGHNINQEVIERRYYLGIKNLKKLYIPVVDSWMVFDNSSDVSKIIAEGIKGEVDEIYDKEIWNIINK
jgi:predicted ABC-type ATPase